MKIKIATRWHFDIQEEQEAIIDIPESVAKEVLTNFLMNKDYEARRDWLIKNVPFSMIDNAKGLF